MLRRSSTKRARAGWLGARRAVLFWCRGYSLWIINSGRRLKDVTQEPVVNGDGSADTTPHVSPDGKTIVFTAVSSAVLLPAVKAEEIALLNRMHIDWIDPTAWFCTPTTRPAVVGNILVYRDNAQMTPSWSRFIAPVVADSIVPVMHSKPASAGRS